MSNQQPNLSAANRAMFVRMSIGDRLRWLMEAREIKQTELAERCGITQSAISNIVTDSSRRPSAPTLMKICAELRCNPQWVLDGEGDPYGWAPVTSESQVELLNLFKSMPESAKLTLLAVARSMKK